MSNYDIRKRLERMLEVGGPKDVLGAAYALLFLNLMERLGDRVEVLEQNHAAIESFAEGVRLILGMDDRPQLDERVSALERAGSPEPAKPVTLTRKCVVCDGTRIKRNATDDGDKCADCGTPWPYAAEPQPEARIGEPCGVIHWLGGDESEFEFDAHDADSWRGRRNVEVWERDQVAIACDAARQEGAREMRERCRDAVTGERLECHERALAEVVATEDSAYSRAIRDCEAALDAIEVE